MFNYLAFIRGGISEPGKSPNVDGAELAIQCLKQLEETGNPEQFPPRLLILLTSPAYTDANQIRHMLYNIRQSFTEYKSRIFAHESSEVALIGSSVEAVFFDRRIHKRGALLICLASRLIETDVLVSNNIRHNYENALDDLLQRLGLSLLGSESNIQKPLTDRLLLSFFPNIGRHDQNSAYLAPELHRMMREKARTRIPIVGGVSSKPGFQFAGPEVYQDEMVAARIFTGSPFSSSFGHGLQETTTSLRVKSLDPDGRTIHKFDQWGSPAVILKLKDSSDFAVLGELSLNHDPLVTTAHVATDGKSVTLLRRIEENSLLRKLALTNPGDVRDETKRIFERSLRWWMLERPIGCLAIHCASRLRSGLDHEAIFADAEKAIREVNAGQMLEDKYLYFGGFFDGEAGADESGRFLFGNWCVATLCFSDEMDETRERTPAHTGFKAISDTAPSLSSRSSLTDALKDSLKVIFETGFPGAMISLVMQDKDGEWLVAVEAIGSRFEKIVDITKRPMDRDDVLAIVARKGEPEFIADSRQDSRCDQEALRRSSIISQYILPLFDREQHLIAVLQFDLGDLRRRGARLFKAEDHILLSLGAVIEATILRVLNREEADLAGDLDQVLMESLRADELNQALQIYIEQAARLFRVENGHIRLLNSVGHGLEMVAGTGRYYEVFKSLRREIGVEDISPTALAFRKGDVVVINDAMKDSFHQVLLEEYCDNRIARDTWEKARSYANVPIKDGDSNLIGTISLISGHSWLFTRPRVRAMVALSQRASYLIEHFKTQKERQFLLDISSDFVRNADFTQPVRTINETVKRFRAAANADIAALFIWDKEAERFVLRAQDGFADEKWVDADRYKRGERWTGSVALADAPQYVADMFAHKMKHHLASAREYETHAFGEPLSAHFTVEAIGLPLRLKRDQTIGVLTLYRRIDPQQPAQVSGFTTINARILQEAADTLSAELSALLYFLRMEWMKKEMKRHEAVRQALEKGDRHVPIEQRLCNQMVKSFHADRAILYLPLNEERQANLYPSADAARENMTPPTTNVPDEMVVQAVRERKIQEKKKNELSIKELQNPETAKTEGLVERIALPLLNEDRLVGVLDLNIRRTRKQSHLVAMHDPEQLEELARKVALVYQQQKELERKAEAEAQAERGRLAVQAMGAMVFQTAHRLLNLTQSIRSLSILIESAKSDHERSQKLSELFKLINSATDGIKRPMEIARQMKDIKPRPYDLHFLVNEALLESDIRQHLSSPDIRALIPEKLMVLVDHDLIREAFRNTIHNAMKAMPNGGSLTINATLSDDSRIAQVVFADTGVGMSEAQKRAALSGFVTTQGGTGLGVLVSLLLIRAQNGDLKIDSKPGEGTKVVVTLPATQREERV